MSASLDVLDRRNTSYRFDVERDLRWELAAAPGRYFTDTFLARLGFDVPAVGRTPGACAALDVLLALSTANVFQHLEDDVIRFVTDQGARHPSVSAQLLVDEEHKHVALFERLAATLAAAFPREAAALQASAIAPPSFDHLAARASDYASADELAFTFWLNTVFFEEYTVFFHQALVEDASAEGAAALPIQPLWLDAHRCHRQEEAQHVLTDAAYLAALPLDAEARRRLSKAFLFFIDKNAALFFGSGAAAQALGALYPGVEGLPGATPLRALPLYGDVLAHAAFRHTRAAAPYLSDQAPRDASASAPAPAQLDGGALAIAADAPRTIGDALERAARTGRGVTFIRPDSGPAGGGEDVLSYASLITEADARRAALVAAGAQPGQHVMLLTALPATTVPWFWACVRAGLPVAPLALPTTATDAEELRRLLRIHQQLSDPIVIADDATAPLVAAALGDAARVLPASARGAARGPPHAALPGELVVIQYSSGSMGDPRGIRLTHNNLLADIRGMLALRGASTDECFVSWMPLFHDMGLIGYHLTPIVAGARQVLMSPISFMRDPLTWLHALTRHRGTITGAPNFALARLAPRLAPTDIAALDLSSLHTFLVGAEPIAFQVLTAFMDALRPAGLRAEAVCPAYGLAEATLAVTMTPRGEAPRALVVSRDALGERGVITLCDARDPHALALVDLGVPLPGLLVTVRDDAGAILPEGRVGSLCVAGASVTGGYHASEATGAPYVDTGDLGAVRNGRLFVTGRKKDVFFIGGRNHYANDVEAVARELPTLHPGAVALVVQWDDRWGVDDLVLFVALRPEVADRRAALAAVHAHVARRIGVQLGRIIEIDKRRMPRTTSGKLKRRVLLERLRAGEFADTLTFTAPNAAPAPVRIAHDDDVVSRVRAVWADVLALPLGMVAADSDFRGLGGDSFQAIKIHDRLEQEFSCAFSPDLLVVGTTPHKMATFVLLARAPQPGASVPALLPSAVSERASPSAGRLAHDGDAVAVVALGVRAPGVQSPEQLWRLVRDRGCTIGPLPAGRTDEARELGALLQGKLARGSWFADVDRFDPAPFGLSDAEARALGPAQRFFLEVAFEALAGASRTSSRVGVFAGAGLDGYARRYADDPGLVTGHSLLGALPNMTAARVARVFGLTGPALTIDTACSSSLAAVHLALDSLRRGECDAAIAGGVQVGLSVELLLSFERAGLLSTNGEARPFDDSASGLVPGEAAGAVLLKRLDDARTDGDTIWAVLRGSAMNNDGGALSGTAPSPQGQMDAVRAAWSNARLSIGTAALLEAHAAGTAVGDAVEVRALTEVLGAPSAPSAGRCAVGSIKGNLGHTLAAAGIMSLLKVVLALRHGAAPPTAGLTHPAERIAFANTPLIPATSVTALAATAGAPLLAGVSSFGLGGTNVHIVVEAGPAADAPTPSVMPLLLALGGPAAARSATFEGMRAALGDGAHLSTIAAAAAGYADALPERRAVVVHQRADLDALASTVGAATATRRGKLAFVLPGPGSQVTGMGRALAAVHPTFASAIEQCIAAASAQNVDLRAILAADDDTIHRIDNAQPAVFALGYALSRWLAHLGVTPQVVIGHSAGEFLAAHLAGMLSLDDALAVVIARGRAMKTAPAGRMAAVSAARGDIERILRPPHGSDAAVAAVVIAAVNAPQQCSIAGPAEALAAAIAALEHEGIVVRPLDIEVAAHTPALAAVRAPLDAALARVGFGRGSGAVALVSTATGDVLSAMDAAHVVRHLTGPVEFVRAVERARALGVDAFVELGATAGLSSCVRQILEARGDDALVASCGVRGEPELGPPLAALAALVDAGFPVRTTQLAPRGHEAPSDVLPWPWQRKRLWIDARPRTQLPAPAHTSPPGVPLSLEGEPAIRDHVTRGVCTAPASLLVDVLFDLARADKSTGGAIDLSRVIVERPLAVAAGEVRTLSVEHDPAAPDAARRALISAGANGVPLRHLAADVTPARGRVTARLDLGEIRARLAREVDGASVYALLASTGFVMGPAMRAVQSVQVGERELLARLVAPAGSSRGRRVDAALLDGASHAVAALFLPAAGVAARARRPLYLGFSMESVRLHRPVHGACLAYVRLRTPISDDPAVLRYDIWLVGGDGEVLAEVEDFGSRRVAVPEPDTSLTVEPSAVPAAPAPVGRADHAELVALLRGLVAHKLRRAPAQIGEHVPLARLGVDSLMAVELVKELERALGTSLHATLLFEAHTIAAVVERVIALRNTGKGSS